MSLIMTSFALFFLFHLIIHLLEIVFFVNLKQIQGTHVSFYSKFCILILCSVEDSVKIYVIANDLGTDKSDEK